MLTDITRHSGAGFDNGGLMRKSLVLLSIAILASLGSPSFADVAPPASIESSVFIAEAGQNALMAVELGKLAQKNARSPGISALGSRLARDHGRMNAVLKVICSEKGFDVPVELDGNHRAVVDRLSALSGVEFDSAYATLMASDHANAITLFTHATEGDDPDLAEFARRTLPSLREHKRLADVYVKVATDNGLEHVASRPGT
jgi:predicted outer membrane protein